MAVGSKSIQALEAEPEGMDAWLERMERSIKYDMQLIVLRELPDSIPSKIYADAFLQICLEVSRKLTHWKGLLYFDINSTIETVNGLISDLKPLAS